MLVYYNDNDNYCCDVIEKNIENGNLYKGYVDRRDIRDVKGEDLKDYGQIHLFAGIGGFPLGFKWAGLPASTSIITGGFPCQPHSVAGKRRGAADDRNLWPEFLRIIKELRPTWIIGENVPGIVSLYLDTVLSDLEGEAYFCWPFNIPACAFDAPHRRERIWIVAHAESDIRGTPRDYRSKSSARGDTLLAHTEGKQDRGLQFTGLAPNTGTGGEDVAYTNQESESRLPKREGTQDTISGNTGKAICYATVKGLQDWINKEMGGGAEWNTFPQPQRSDWWTVEPDVGRVAHGVPSRVDRLRSLGNAVVPQVVEFIGRRIMEGLPQQESGVNDAA